MARVPNSNDIAELAFLLSARGLASAPRQAPEKYVATGFDAYAAVYEEHLVQQLHYSVPTLLRSAVMPFLSSRETAILDLGCGSGLTGQAFIDLAARIDGVDLSTEMLRKAREGGCYRYLLQMDATAALEHVPRPYQLVVLGDVLPYIGDLRAIFRGAKSVLDSGGLFAFTCEVGDVNTYAVTPTRRYVHSEAYVRACLAGAGLNALHWEFEVLRKEGSQPVQGLVGVATVADGPAKELRRGWRSQR